jgi:hypothetical protein
VPNCTFSGSQTKTAPNLNAVDSAPATGVAGLALWTQC